MSTVTSAPAPTTPWRWLRAHPNGLLLGAQLLGIVVYPFLASDARRAGFSLFQLLVLVLAVGACRRTPALTWVSVLLGVPAAVLTAAEVLVPEAGGVELASNATHALFYLYLAYGLLRYMFSDHYVTRDELLATGSCFTVIAWGFAYLYGAVQNLWGAGQFQSSHSDPSSPLTWMELLFLSFTTMTNTGLSDISPVGDHARSVVMLEQLAGLNYIALVVARLLAMMMAKFRPAG